MELTSKSDEDTEYVFISMNVCLLLLFFASEASGSGRHFRCTTEQNSSHEFQQLFVVWSTYTQGLE